MSEHHNHTAGNGSVLLDIGGEFGALIVTMPMTMAGAEIEICPAGEPHAAAPRDHVGVHARPGGSFAAVFPSVRRGVYELYRKPHGPTELVATVIGGLVTEADWPP
jgi:hypothetical protein